MNVAEQLDCVRSSIIPVQLGVGKQVNPETTGRPSSSTLCSAFMGGSVLCPLATAVQFQTTNGFVPPTKCLKANVQPGTRAPVNNVETKEPTEKCVVSLIRLLKFNMVGLCKTRKCFQGEGSNEGSMGDQEQQLV